MTPFSGSLLVVSPHPDDAALSCSALLERGEPVEVVTVFGGAPDPPRRGYWDERCGFRDSAEAMRVRRAEELQALAPGGHRVRFLDLLEEQYAEHPRGPAEVQAIAAVVEEHGDGLVAAPAGAGRNRNVFERLVGRGSVVPPHPDHVFVRDAVLAAARGPVLLYEEFPYARSRSGEPAVAAVGRTAEALRIDIDREAKARRIAAYASQLPHLGGPDERFDRPEQLPPVERYWLVSAPESGA